MTISKGVGKVQFVTKDEIPGGSSELLGGDEEVTSDGIKEDVVEK